MRSLYLSLSLLLIACSFDGSVPIGELNPDGSVPSSDGTSLSDSGTSSDVDAMTSDTDMDGDTILDAVDNCPTVANPNQFNEDGDSLGNLCDNCPAEDNEQQANADLDEVGDACDPQPGQANQLIHFEGFDQLPAGDWDGLSSWQVNSGSLVQNDNSQRYYLRYEAAGGSNKIRVVSKIQFSNPLGPNGIAFRYGGVFVEANDEPDNNGCWVLRSLSQPVEGYSGVSVSNGSPTGSTPIGPKVRDNSDYVIANSVDGSTRSCVFEFPGNDTVSFNYSGSNFNGEGIGIVTSYTQARVAYVYAVRLQ